MTPRAPRPARSRSSREALARTLALVLGVLVLVAPRTAAACATCISSGYGDRSFTWAYLGLILMPFVIAVAIVAVLAWYAGWRREHIQEHISAWTARLRHRPARAELSPRTHTETT
jgi:hypothetical protein